MDGQTSQKNGILKLERGGWAGQRELTPEEWLEREVRSWGAQGRTADGARYATRATADIAQWMRFPERVPARIIRDGLEEGASPSWARRFGIIMSEYADRKARAMRLQLDDPQAA